MPRILALALLSACLLFAQPASFADDEGTADAAPAEQQGPRLEAKAEFTAHKPWVRCLAFHPKAEILASGGNDRALRLWNPTTLDLVAEAKVGRRPWAEP